MTSSWLVYALGFTAQGLFSARVLVQWLLSEKSRKVVSPTLFWVLSLVASSLYVVYGWLREDFAIMLGQVIGYNVYIWNLWAKGVWQRLGRVGGRCAVAAFLLMPVVFIVSMLVADGSAVVDTLFKNGDLPLWLLLFGSAGQLIFSVRFLYQFIYSSRRGESILPKGFWIISLSGSMMIVTYGILRHDPVLILGQGLGLISYTRNLMLWNKSHAKG